MLKVGGAFAASALLSYLIGDAVLRRRDALLHDDSHLLARVRLRVAQLVSGPDAIQVQVDQGLVRVSGHVPATERDRLLSQLTRVPGVYRVYNALVSVNDGSALTRGASDAGPAWLP
jgi:hypothetical protein